MSLRIRFLLSLLAVLALMAGPALYGVTRVSMLRDIVLELHGQGAESALAAGRLEAALVRIDHGQRTYVATGDARAAELMRSGAAEAVAAIVTLRAAGYGDLLTDADIHVDVLTASAAHITALVEQGRFDDATSFLVSRASPLVERARGAVPGIAVRIDERTSARVPVARRSAVAAATATTAAVLVGVALSIVLALAAARQLTGPLDGLRRAMARVAEGTFDAPSELPDERTDEIGDLSRSFKTMTRRLAELDRMKADFVGTISHDLKTPVSVIAGYAELMQEELGPLLTARQGEMLRSMSDQTRTLQRRMDQLVEFSRMESGRLKLGLEEIDLRNFVEDVQREFAPAARLCEVRLELFTHDATPPSILADPDVLRADIVGNLMANALKYTPPGGTISLSVRPDGPRVILEIADTGPGIPQDQLERIFDRYYQSRGTTRGSGLGLTIAKAGVENHGGRIEARSRIGHGTRVRVTLPGRSVSSAYAASAGSVERAAHA
jgi:signal transduction histidine kinase